MRFCHFLNFRAEHEPTPSERAAVSALLADTPGVAHALLHTPASTHDPYLNDGRPPSLVIQSYFGDIQALEAAFAAGGRLQGLLDLLPSQLNAEATQEAMAVRRFLVPDPVFQVADGAPHCSYLVAYVGPAVDLNAWLTHYIGHHPPIMAKFPGIRQIEITSRIDWTGALPVPRFAHMQRNKVVFDSPEALTEALNSPARHALRADFHEFPAYEGGNTHYPMRTWNVVKGR